MKSANGNYERLQFLKARSHGKLIALLNKIEGISELIQFVVMPTGFHGVWVMTDMPSRKIRTRNTEKVEQALPTQTEEIKK
jgi:hypothetical protein